MSVLFSQLKLRTVVFKNRIFLSPMCQYSSQDGLPTDWHLVHLGGRAVGGAALILTEATAVSPEGRISPCDCGIWADRHIAPFKRITAFIQQQGAVPGIQLAHAGRKASTDVPWRGGKPLAAGAGGWQPLGPSPAAFSEAHTPPRAMTAEDITSIVAQFAAGARRSLAAGFQVAEIHMAHGYLLHQFLSPLSNQRCDEYGGSLENRLRLPLQVAAAMRQAWPADLPLFARLSCTDWTRGGWDLPQAVELSRQLKKIGVDLIDCSSGGLLPAADIPLGPGYQTPFAAEIRAKVRVATGAVGLITEPVQAEQVLATGQADAVLLGRELLRNPHWPLHAARTLAVDLPWPGQYLRAKQP
jgi:2,4-dienoyl-CoA reductase-like NADH-dependent reductase (Old Yellow Enzyme family)